jgi:hypothetical protein
MKPLVFVSQASCNSPRRQYFYLFVVSLVLTLGSAMAQSDLTPEQSAEAEGIGGSSTIVAGKLVTPSIGAVVSAAAFTGAQFASGGVGLRNRATGAIGISGVVPPVKAAFIYWAVITSGPAPTADKSILVQRLFPTPASTVTNVTGTIIGTGPQPCWAGDTITVLRASIPTSVATGNGLYKITLLSGASGSTSGGDPWLGTALPLMEGASIVIIGTGTSTQEVALYDSGLAGTTFHGNPGISYSLALPVAASGVLTLFDNIGADGQQGVSRKAISGYGDEITKINGKIVAGPGSLYGDSDWNGSSAQPLPQLWDDTGHDITVATPSGTKSLNITIANRGEATYDCLTPVANVVSFKPVGLDFPPGSNFQNVAANDPAHGNVWTGIAQSFTAQDSHILFGFYVGNFTGASVSDTLLFSMYSGDGQFSNLLGQASATASLASFTTKLVQVDFSSISLTPGNHYTVVASLPSQQLPPLGTYSDLSVSYNSLNNSYPGGRFYFVGASYDESLFALRDLAFNVTYLSTGNP